MFELLLGKGAGVPKMERGGDSWGAPLKERYRDGRTFILDHYAVQRRNKLEDRRIQAKDGTTAGMRWEAGRI